MKTIKQAFEAGKDCGINGANTENCDFRYFATWELINAHSEGVKEGKKIASDRFKE
jgi:hypothetical protein